jgi:hypothetical protein
MQPVTTAAPDQSRKIWPLRARAFGINIDETTSPRPRHHMPGPIVATDPQALIATTRNQVPCPPRRRRCACRLPPVPASHTSDLTSAPATARPRRARPACACRAHPSYPTPAARLPAFKTPSRVRQQQPRRSVKKKIKIKILRFGARAVGPCSVSVRLPCTPVPTRQNYEAGVAQDHKLATR